MEKISIIASAKDTAGLNIRNSLISQLDFENTGEKFDNNDVYQCDKLKNKIIKLCTISQDLIFAENIDKSIDADILIFASKHRSRENRKSFTVHPIGNFGKAEFGGKEKALCPSSAILLKNLFIELNNAAKETDYELTLEATHHGPYVEKPAVFVEIGSTEKEWSDKKNGKIIAEAIMSALKNENTNYKIAVGIGGPHYCSNFNKIMLRDEIAISHICPKYNLNNLDENFIRQAIKKTMERVDFVLLDWKGLGTEKQRIAEILKNLNLEVSKIK